MPLLILIGLAVLAFPFVMPIVTWISHRHMRRRIDVLEEYTRHQQHHIDTLGRLIDELRGTATAPVDEKRKDTGPASTTIAAGTRPVVEQPVARAAPPPSVETRREPLPRPQPPLTQPPLVSPAVEPPPVSPGREQSCLEEPASAQNEQPIAARPSPAAQGVSPPSSAPLSAPVSAVPSASPLPSTPVAQGVSPAPSPAPPASPPPPRYPTTEPPPPPAPPFDWESLIGVKLFSAIAGIALVIAAIFFLRYSIEHGWLEPPVRVAIGVIVAVALLIVCELKAAREYPATANALDAAAIAILFATFFSAHALWHLVPASVAFGLLALVTAIAVLLAIRRESLFIAVLGLLGGFSTPALLSSGENRPIPLFAYLLLLNIGLAWVAYKRRWPILATLSLALTTLYQWGWVFTYLSVSQLPLAAGIFLLFPIVSFVGISLARPQRDRPSADDATFERTALLAAGLPLLFALYLAAVPEYGPHAGILFGFLLLLDAGLLAVGLARREEVLHASTAAATLLVFAVWLATSYHEDAYRTVLMVLLVFVPFFAFAPAIAARSNRPFTGIARQAIYTAPFLLAVPMALAATARAGASPWVLFAVLFVLVAVLAWRAVAGARGPVYFVAAFFAVAAQAVWSANHLDIGHLSDGVAIYAAFGLLSLAVPILARRAGQRLEPHSGSGVVLLASLALQLFLATGSATAPAALWGMALLIAILDAGLFVESAAERLPVVSIAGSVLSWVVLAAWWSRSAAIVGLLPSLLVIVLLALVMLGGHAWSYLKNIEGDVARAPQGEMTSDVVSGRFRTGLFLGLVGHLFILYIALNAAWSVPPWPMFASLGVLTLAVSVTSLVTRVDRLHAGGVAAAIIVVLAWASIARVSPWPITALASGGAICAFALSWMRVPSQDRNGTPSPTSRTGRAQAPPRREEINVRGVAAGVALFTMELVAIAAGAQPGAPALGALILSHALALTILLALTWREQWSFVAPLSVLPAWLAVLSWQNIHADAGHWRGLLLLAGVLYTIFTAYPFVLGRRVGHSREPHLTAVLGAALFFFGARRAFILGGLGWMMGAIPVFEGAVLALLLRQLLRAEPSGQRDLGRLALVAGAALALITVAIPVQLSHQWITIGWALEGAALSWLYSRIPHKGLLWSAVALLTVVFVRLALNPEIFHYEPRGSLRIFNWYLYTYVVCAASHFAAVRFLAHSDDRIGIRDWRVIHLLSAAGVILLFIVLNIEIGDYYATGPEITFRFGVTVAQDLTYTIGWLVFGMAMLAAGIYVKSHAARVAALGMLAVTTFKAFLYDLGSLGGLYRVGSLLGLAVSLTLVSLALQRFVLRPAREK